MPSQRYGVNSLKASLLSAHIGNRDVAVSVLFLGRRAPRVFDVEDGPQILGHEVGFEGRAVVPLQVLQEAQEEGVDGHLVDVEEHVGDEVGADDDNDDGDEVVVEIRRVNRCDSTYQLRGQGRLFNKDHRRAIQNRPITKSCFNSLASPLMRKPTE